jgi:hypothetical protein
MKPSACGLALAAVVAVQVPSFGHATASTDQDIDSAKFQVIPNPLNRFLLNKESGLEPNRDGSLTLAFAPRKPIGLPEPNWRRHPKVSPITSPIASTVHPKTS